MLDPIVQDALRKLFEAQISQCQRWLQHTEEADTKTLKRELKAELRRLTRALAKTAK